jgi:hypothetical protein
MKHQAQARYESTAGGCLLTFGALEREVAVFHTFV